MGNIDAAFAGYLKACNLERASAIQIMEMRRAFFAGATVLWSILSSEDGDKELPTIAEELRAFGAELDERCKDTMVVDEPSPQRGLPPFVDLNALSEDERIHTIGVAAMAGNIVGVMVEREDRQKVQRYIDKLKKRFPTVRLVSKTDNTGRFTMLRFGPPTNG